MFLVSLLIIANTASAIPADKECVSWFRDQKLAAGKEGCLLACATADVDMSTYYCHNQCDELCDVSTEQHLLFQYVYYPGLTIAEQALIATFPSEALTVFRQMLETELRTGKYFPKPQRNDEADAFRHFTWAARMTREFGAENAKKFLDAHEDNPRQPEAEKAMDLANNRAGILEAEKFIKLKKMSDQDVERMALKELRERKLSVLNKVQEIPKDVLP